MGDLRDAAEEEAREGDRQEIGDTVRRTVGRGKGDSGM